MNAPVSNPAMAAMRRGLDEALKIQTIRQILARNALSAHYQPIVRLKDGAVMGHESLIRGPVDSPLRLPDALFHAARAEGLSVELEQAVSDEGVRSWAMHSRDKRLFVNLSAHAIVEMMDRPSLSALMKTLDAAAVTPAALVIEITEHERVTDLSRLIEVASCLRAQGFRFALDDFGDGRSSLRLWAELRPEIVKIDKYFIHDLPNRAVKVQTLKGLTRFAEIFGTALVAEGIETESELEIVRDLGIELGQGYFLGRPSPAPAMAVPEHAGEIIASSQIAVLPELARAAADFTIARLATNVLPLSPDLPVDDAATSLPIIRRCVQWPWWKPGGPSGC